MKLIKVDYPFTVDTEPNNTCSRVYSTLKAALADAQACYAQQAEEEEDYEDDVGIQSGRVAVVHSVTVTKLTRGHVCAIINSGGGAWCADSQQIGCISWDAKRQRVKYTTAIKE